MELIVAPTPAAAARALAGRLTVLARQAMGRRGVFNLVLGAGPGSSPLFEALVNTEIFWGRVNVFQLDEGVPGDGARARSATVLLEELSDQVGLPPGRLHVVDPVAPDRDAAARRFAASLPDHVDVAVLGLAADGRLAGWPVAAGPTDDGLDELGGAALAMVGPAEDRRLTLTPVVVNRAEHRFVLAVGADCRAALTALAAGEPASWAARRLGPAVAYADRAAADEQAE